MLHESKMVYEAVEEVFRLFTYAGKYSIASKSTPMKMYLK